MPNDQHSHRPAEPRSGEPNKSARPDLTDREAVAEIERRLAELLASVRDLIDELPDPVVEAHARSVERVIAALEALSRDELDALSAPSPDNPAGSGAWRPIETAPKDGTEVDLWLAPLSEDGYPLTPCRLPNAHFHCGEWLFWGGDPEIGWLSVDHRVTHWMPVPSPPCLDDAGGGEELEAVALSPEGSAASPSDG